MATGQRPLRAIIYVSVSLLLQEARNVCEARIVGAAVIPHGDFAYDCTLVGCHNGSREIHENSASVGHWLSSLGPDLVFLSTPHGLEATEAYLLYGNSNGSGVANIGQDLHNASFPGYNVRMRASLAKDVVDDIVSGVMFGQDQAHLSTLLAFGDGQDIPLGWGEIVPLSFLGSIVNSSNPRAKVVALSIPSKRYEHVVEMVSLVQHITRRVSRVTCLNLHVGCSSYPLTMHSRSQSYKSSGNASEMHSRNCSNVLC